MKTQWFRRFAFLVASASLGSCATSGDPLRQPWRDSWSALPAAKSGNPTGLRRAFDAARRQLMLPYQNAGEDAEAIDEHFDIILKSVGDDAFAAALLREKPTTRSAVREFFSQFAVRESYPKTYQVLCDAPLVKWPSDGEPKQIWSPSSKDPMRCCDK